MVILDKIVTAACREEGYAREARSRIQQLRKKSKLNPEDQVNIYYAVGPLPSTDNSSSSASALSSSSAAASTSSCTLATAIQNQLSLMNAALRLANGLQSFSALPSNAFVIAREDFEVLGEQLTIVITRPI